jgi:hypothetical protein
MVSGYEQVYADCLRTQAAHVVSGVVLPDPTSGGGIPRQQAAD